MHAPRACAYAPYIFTPALPLYALQGRAPRAHAPALPCPSQARLGARAYPAHA
jgi:hypothetical protein